MARLGLDLDFGSLDSGSPDSSSLDSGTRAQRLLTI